MEVAAMEDVARRLRGLAEEGEDDFLRAGVFFELPDRFGEDEATCCCETTLTLLMYPLLLLLRGLVLMVEGDGADLILPETDRFCFFVTTLLSPAAP